MSKKPYLTATPESFMREQTQATWWFILLIGIMPILSIAILFQIAPININHVLTIGIGTASAGFIVGLIFRQRYLKATASQVILLATPEPNKPPLTDLRAVVEEVGALIKEYEHRTTKEIEGFEIRTAQLSVLLAEAQSNEERLSAALAQMQRVLGLKEGSEVVDSGQTELAD